MSDEAPSWLGWVKRAFGVGQHGVSNETASLRIYIPLIHKRPAPDGRILVGTLTSEDGMWTFRYDPEYAADPRRPPISAFPHKAQEYRSTELWPFFDLRLPLLDREDIRDAVQREGIAEEDKLRLLGVLSKRAVTSPFEFELAQEPA